MFGELKEALTSAPVLAYPKFGPECEFILKTDASYIGLGAILSQLQDDLFLLIIRLVCLY